MTDMMSVMVLSNSADDGHDISNGSTATVVIANMVPVMVYSNSGVDRNGVSDGPKQQ